MIEDMVKAMKSLIMETLIRVNTIKEKYRDKVGSNGKILVICIRVTS
jgi:hypothetical protein